MSNLFKKIYFVALIDKLLRSCSDVEKLYLLIRTKNGRNVSERVEEIFKDPVS